MYNCIYTYTTKVRFFVTKYFAERKDTFTRFAFFRSDKYSSATINYVTEFFRSGIWFEPCV